MLVLRLEQSEEGLLKVILKNVCRPDLERLTKDSMTSEQKDSLDKLLFALMEASEMRRIANAAGVGDNL